MKSRIRGEKRGRLRDNMLQNSHINLGSEWERSSKQFTEEVIEVCKSSRMMTFAKKSQAKKNRDMVNCFHRWLAGWENQSLRFKVQFTMIKVIFRSPHLAWRDNLRSNPVQSPHIVTRASGLSFCMPLAALLLILAVHSALCLFLLTSGQSEMQRSCLFMALNIQGFHLETEFALYSPLRRRSYWPELLWIPTGPEYTQLYKALPGTRTQTEGWPHCYGSAPPFFTHS